MPRKPCVYVAGGIYHVMLPGNARHNIFNDDADRLVWQRLLNEGIDTYRHRIHAYCWMTNHVHMAVQAGQSSLSGFIGTLASRYAKVFNKKYERSGHLFERRHRAILVQEERYLLELVRYIHQNPLRARMVSTINEYPWSSHAAYIGATCPTYLTTGMVMSMFGSGMGASRQQYLKHMGELPAKSVVEHLNSESNNTDNLPDDEWFNGERHYEHNQSNWETLEQLIHRHCQRHGLTESQLGSSSRARDHATVRALIAIEATDKSVAAVTEIARRFGRSQPALSRTMNRLRRQLK